MFSDPTLVRQSLELKDNHFLQIIFLFGPLDKALLRKDTDMLIAIAHRLRELDVNCTVADKKKLSLALQDVIPNHPLARVLREVLRAKINSNFLNLLVRQIRDEYENSSGILRLKKSNNREYNSRYENVLRYFLNFNPSGAKLEIFINNYADLLEFLSEV